MMKFETINNTLCRMVEPEPLTPEANFPCVVNRREDGDIGRYTKWHCSGLIGEQLVVKEIIDGKVVFEDAIWTLCELPYLYFEIIGYPVEEGSRWWALYQMMQGKKVSYKSAIGNVCWVLNQDGNVQFCYMDDLAYIGTVRSKLEFAENYALETGWQLYEPEPEPAQFKVGDWVEHKESKEQGRITYISTDDYDAIEVKLYDQDEPEIYTKSDFNADFRKLKPSEVEVDFGSFRGWIKRASNYNIEVYSKNNCWVANIRYNMLDAPTRELVESLLKAQEEK